MVHEKLEVQELREFAQVLEMMPQPQLPVPAKNIPEHIQGVTIVEHNLESHYTQHYPKCMKQRRLITLPRCKDFNKFKTLIAREKAT